MRNNVFEKILDSKIDTFVKNFSIDSKNFFVDQKGKLIHPRRVWNIQRRNI